MVHNYLNKLYLNNTELADGFNFEKMGHIMLRLMPRSYMQYRVANFPADIRKTLEDPRFTSLLARSPPSGMANLYKYEGSLRSFEDKDFVYQCTMIHDISTRFLDDLKSLDNKAAT